MTQPHTLREAIASYGSQRADLETPLILETEGLPMAVVLSFEEYRRLRTLAADVAERQQAAWSDFAALLHEVHARPSALDPQQIESEITAARAEVKRSRRARSSRR